MLIRRLFAFSYAHGSATLCMMSSSQTAPHTKTGVHFSPARLKSLERFEERWGCNSFLKSNSISLTAKLIESYHPAGDTARPKGRKSRSVLFA